MSSGIRTKMMLNELLERLEKARFALIKLKSEAALYNESEETRLAGKLEGVSLAISYLREYERFNDGN
jgi:hypothetical protein